MRNEIKEAVEFLKDANEKQLREFDVPHPENQKELSAIIDVLINRNHDYGTCVYAMSISAVAAFNLIAKTQGVTGFQASCADLDILGRIRHWKNGFRVINYDDLLYPQYKSKFDECSWEALLEENKEILKKRAQELLNNHDRPHPNVRAHWERLASAK